MVKGHVLFLQNNYPSKPAYLLNLILPKLNSLWDPDTYSAMRCRRDYFKNSFIPYVVREKNKLDTEIRNCTSFSMCILFHMTFTIHRTAGEVGYHF